MLLAVLCLNAAFLVIEAVAGAAFDSLALLADAAHLLSDVAALGVALVANALVSRPASSRHSFGLQRAEVLGAQVNGVILVAAAGWVVVEALDRLGDEPDVDGGGLLVVALLGLVANLVGAVALHRVSAGDLNIRGAALHLAADAIASVGAVVAGVAVVVADATWVDPAVSIGIAALVLVSAGALLREATHVLLEGTPRGIDPTMVATTIEAVPGVTGVHHLHLWSLGSDAPALSAHVVLDGEPSLHDAQARGDEVRDLLGARFGIAHATLELECHPCEPPGCE